MMSLSTIRAMERRMARESRAAGKKPYLLTRGALASIREHIDAGLSPHFPFPAIGDRNPRGYRKVAEWFVDSSGFGSESEPAMTVRRLASTLLPGMAYAITSVGQFQCYLGVFLPPKDLRSPDTEAAMRVLEESED